MVPDLVDLNPTGLRPNALAADCPSRRLLALIADKWTILIIHLLARGPKRHGQLRRQIDGISQKMLTQTLRALEREGIVERTVYPVVPPMVEYALTPRGQSLIEPLDALHQWAEAVGAEELATTAIQPDSARA